MAEPTLRYVYNSQYHWWEVLWLRPDGIEVHFKVCKTEREAQALVAAGNERPAHSRE